MSAIVTKFICSTIMAISGLIVVKKLSQSQIKITNFRSAILLLCVVALPIANYNVEYTYLSTISIYLMTIFAYKYILNISLTKAFIADSILMIFMIMFDWIFTNLLSLFFSVEFIRSTWYINISFNLLTGLGLIAMFSIKIINQKLSNFVDKIECRKMTSIIIFFIITVITMSGILYLFFIDCKLEQLLSTNSLILIILFLLVIILVSERNNYDKLALDYDNLFDCIQTFEEWIENEQLNRHEYKNQLAVLRCMTKEKKVKEKIDDIINGYIDIDDKTITKVKNIPRGGIKGLLYYKIIVARKQKLNIDIDIDKNVSKMLKILNKQEMKIISQLVGIYCDNAIEAACETKKKVVLIELYEINDFVNIVISNTYDKNKDISNRYQKGITTKGEGRGNGLYFASKLLSKNKWIEEHQDIRNDYYIQKIIIKKNTKNAL